LADSLAHPKHWRNAGLLLQRKKEGRLFENRVQGGMFGTKEENITGWWIKLQNEYLHNFYPSNGWVMKHMGGGGGEMHPKFWSRKFMGRK
jgi:hypothetical protein